MWASGPPLHRSEGRVKLIMIWVIITEQRKRKRDGERVGGRMTEKRWVVREVFFILSPSLLNDYYPQCWWCPLSVSDHPTPRRKSQKRDHVFHQVSWGGDWRPPDVPQLLDGFHPVPLLLFAHNMERLRWYTQLHWICMEICAYISIHSPLISRLYMPLLSGLISKEKHISQELWPLLSKFTGNDKQHS